MYCQKDETKNETTFITKQAKAIEFVMDVIFTR